MKQTRPLRFYWIAGDSHFDSVGVWSSRPVNWWLDQLTNHTGNSWTVPLTCGRCGHPPPFDLAQFHVRHLYLEGQSGNPHVELQLSTQVAICEVHHHPHFALHLLAIDEDIVTPVRHLHVRGAEDLEAAFNWSSSDCCTGWRYSELHSKICCMVSNVGRALRVDYKALHSQAPHWYRIPTLNKMKGPLSAPRSLRERREQQGHLWTSGKTGRALLFYYSCAYS